VASLADACEDYRGHATVGTQDEMAQFQSAYQRVMSNAVATGWEPRKTRSRGLDGVLLPARAGDYS